MCAVIYTRSRISDTHILLIHLLHRLLNLRLVLDLSFVGRVSRVPFPQAPYTDAREPPTPREFESTAAPGVRDGFTFVNGGVNEGHGDFVAGFEVAGGDEVKFRVTVLEGGFCGGLAGVANLWIRVTIDRQHQLSCR